MGVGQSATRIHRVRIDGEAGLLPRKTRILLCQTQVAANQVKSVLRIGAIENRERGIESNAVGVFAEQAIADRVERSGPGDFATRPEGSWF